MTAVLISNKAAELDSLSELLAFSNKNCELIRFTDPLLSVKFILDNRVDLIIVDEYMRPVDGVGMLKMIRKLRPNMPVVILATDEHMGEQARQLHADGYWRKPVDNKNIAEIPQIMQRQYGLA